MIKQYLSNYVSLSQLLIGEITRNVAGVSLHIEDNMFIIRVVFFNLPDEDEIENFEIIEAEFISTHNKKSNLSIFNLNDLSETSLKNIKGNIGWVFLRKEAVYQVFKVTRP